MYLVFDTETTGKANLKLMPSHPSQPRLVQLGAILYNDQHRVLQEINLIVKPEGFTIPKEASDIHGVTHEMAMECGIDEVLALQMFFSIAQFANTYVCHNTQFDELIIRTAYDHHDWDEGEEFLNLFTADRFFCTMKAMTPICRLRGPYGFKWPNLQEAHIHCAGVPFEGAHDAMADVRACATVYRWLVGRPPEPETQKDLPAVNSTQKTNV